MNPRVLIDLAAKAGSTRDQGKRPTCVAFALSDLHASVRSSAVEPLSVEYLFYQACRLAPSFKPHSGVTLQQALRALDKEGQPVEDAWPYLQKLPSDLSQYQPPANLGPVYRRSSRVIPGKAVDKITEEICGGRPTVLVLRSSLRLVLARPGQPVSWSPSDQLLNPHAALAVAIGKARSERFVRVKNSWGLGWADMGYAWLSEEYIDNTVISLVGMV